jgi:hypothetical protein
MKSNHQNRQSDLTGFDNANERGVDPQHRHCLFESPLEFRDLADMSNEMMAYYSRTFSSCSVASDSRALP